MNIHRYIKVKVKVWFYIAQYPVHWTAQSALHFPPLADLFILAMQQLRNDYSLTFPPLSIARYSFIQLSRLRRREVKENAQTSKRYQRGFEPGLSRLRVRHSTTEPPRSTIVDDIIATHRQHTWQCFPFMPRTSDVVQVSRNYVSYVFCVIMV